MCRNNIDFLFLGELNNEYMNEIIKDICIIGGLPVKELYNYVINNNENYQFVLYDNKNKNKCERLKIVKSTIMKLKIINKSKKNIK